MSDEQKLELVLERIEPGRRSAVRKILLGAAIYAVPVVASFSLNNLGGVAQAQGANQTVAAPVPTTSAGGLVGMAAIVAAAGALLLRRVRGR